LEVKASNFIVKSNRESIGWGLFSKNKIIKKGEIVTMYIGQNIKNSEWNQRNNLGLGGYGVYVDSYTVKDCRETFSKRECFASAVNCFKNLIDKDSGVKAQKNAYMIIKNGNIFLKSSVEIPPYSEIFLDKYGKNYRFSENKNLIKAFFE